MLAADETLSEVLSFLEGVGIMNSYVHAHYNYNIHLSKKH